MSTEIINLIIGISSAVFGVILATFKDEIMSFFSSNKKFNYLKGSWQCAWKESPNNKYVDGRNIFDNVQINSIKGMLLKGKGETRGVGKWYFSGKLANETLTLIYKNEKGDDRSGTILLKLYNNSDSLEGTWQQYRQGEIASGTTVWEKL